MNPPNGHILALPPGYVLESYRIERVLGEGGFGITYLAIEMESEKQVAIKEMLPADIATRVAGSTVVPKGEQFRESFEWALDCFGKEAKSLAKLSHPNIVPIHRLFRANGTAYMVMDFVEGQSFSQWLKQHPQPTEAELKGFLLPLLDGLEHVHEASLLHRDIKPDNIFITAKGRPVLLDFGSARVDTGRTQTMTAVVSEGYSPFEQYQTRVRMGPATDLYSLAAVMVRAITGQTPPASADRIADESFFTPVSKTHAPRYSASFLRAVDAAFAVKAQDRPQNVAALRGMLCGEKVPGKEAEQPQLRGLPWKRRIVGVAVTAILIVAGFIWWSTAEIASRGRAEEQARQDQQAELARLAEESRLAKEAAEAARQRAAQIEADAKAKEQTRMAEDASRLAEQNRKKKEAEEAAARSRSMAGNVLTRDPTAAEAARFQRGDVAGSNWFAVASDDEKVEWRFLSDGTVEHYTGPVLSRRGEWQAQGNSIEMKVGLATVTAAFKNNRMEGTGESQGKSWTFQAALK